MSTWSHWRLCFSSAGEKSHFTPKLVEVKCVLPQDCFGNHFQFSFFRFDFQTFQLLYINIQSSVMSDPLCRLQEDAADTPVSHVHIMWKRKLYPLCGIFHLSNLYRMAFLPTTHPPFLNGVRVKVKKTINDLFNWQKVQRVGKYTENAWMYLI